MNKTIWLALGIAVTVIIVGLVWFTNNRGESSEKQTTTPTTSQTTSTAESTNQEESKTDVETTQLTAVEGYSGDGMATRSFDETTFTHTVTANIGDPAQGKFYEGWLVNSSPTLKFFSTGKLVKKDDKYTLNFTAKQDYPDYPEVVITEETEANGLDGNPESHVFEGSF